MQYPLVPWGRTADSILFKSTLGSDSAGTEKPPPPGDQKAAPSHMGHFLLFCFRSLLAVPSSEFPPFWQPLPGGTSWRGYPRASVLHPERRAPSDSVVPTWSLPTLRGNACWPLTAVGGQLSFQRDTLLIHRVAGSCHLLARGPLL